MAKKLDQKEQVFANLLGTKWPMAPDVAGPLESTFATPAGRTSPIRRGSVLARWWAGIRQHFTMYSPSSRPIRASRRSAGTDQTAATELHPRR